MSMKANPNNSSLNSSQENNTKLMNSFNSPEQINDDEVDLYYIDQQLITNIMEHFYSLIQILEKTKKMIDDYKSNVSTLRQDVNKLRHNIINENDETKNRVIPLLESLRRNFFNQMYVDKAEQDSLQKELIQLKKEKYEMEEMITWCLSKMTVLEDQIGYYKKLKQEKKEEEEYQKKKSVRN